MKRIAIAFAVLVAGCGDFNSDCDQRIKDLYPGEDIKVMIVASALTVYIVQDRYITCSTKESRMVIRAVKPVSWEEAYCSRMTDPPECLRGQKGNP
jgi:hypothetical protein